MHSVAAQDAKGFLGAGGTGKFRVFEKSVRDGMRAVKIVVVEDKVGSLKYEEEIRRKFAGKNVRASSRLEISRSTTSTLQR